MTEIYDVIVQEEIFDVVTQADGSVKIIPLGISLSETTLNAGALPPLPPPANEAAGGMAFFGLESATRLADAPGRGLSLPAGALLMPNAGVDWFYTLHLRTGNELAEGTQVEIAASAGNNFTSGSGNNRAIALKCRQNSDGLAWRWQTAINSTNRDMLAGLAPALTTQAKVQFGDWCIMLACVSGLPYVAMGRLGMDNEQRFFARAPSIAAFDSFHFPAGLAADSIQRTGGVVTVLKASLVGSYSVGKVVHVRCTADSSFNGIYTIATRLGGNAGFTFAQAGADTGVLTGASYVEQRAPVDLFKALGRLETDIAGDASGWAGGIQRVELRYGTAPVTGGQIDAAWFTKVAHRMLADVALPGARQYAATLDPATGYAAEAGGVVSTAATAIGTVMRAPALTPGYVLIDAWDFEVPFPGTFGQETGIVDVGFSAIGVIDGLMGQIEDASGAVLLTEREICGTDDLANGRGTIRIEGVPRGTGRYLRAWWGNNPDASILWGPFSVDDVILNPGQSTTNVLYSTASTGGTLAPIASASGVPSIIGVAGDLGSTGTNPTDKSGDWCRVAGRRIVAAGQVGDGILAGLNKMVEVRSTARGAPAAACFININRSGHPAEGFIFDGRTVMNSIGVASAGVAKAGQWLPHPNWTVNGAGVPFAPVYTKAATARLFRGGVLALADPADPFSDYVLTGGVEIAATNSAGVWQGAVTGSFNKDDGSYSITDPVGGALYIQAEVQYDTPTGSTSPRQNDGFTVWGKDDVADTGHISNVLKQLRGVTAVYYAHANYELSFASSATQAAVNASVAADIGALRHRIDTHYPKLAGVPWIIGADPRTTSTSSIGEHKMRVAQRTYALNTPNTHWAIGAITAEMDEVSNSPHFGPDAESGQLVGITMAHGALAAQGVPGALAQEVMPLAAVRSVDGTTMDITFTPPAGGASITAGGGEAEGLYWGAAPGALALLDLATVTVTITGPNSLRVVLGTGTWPAVTYWNYGVGFVIPYINGTTEDTRLANALSLDSGGYNGIRPGQPVSFSPADILATQA